MGHHHAVAGGSPGQHKIAVVHLPQQLKDLVGHHPAQSGCNPLLGDPFVGGVGAVGFAEHRTASGYLVGWRRFSPAGGVFQGRPQPSQLLKEELSGACGAFVAGKDIGDLATGVQLVDHKGFAAGGDDPRAVDTLRFGPGIGQFHRLRFSNGRHIENAAKFSSRGRHLRCCRDIDLRQGRQHGLAGIAFVGCRNGLNDPCSGWQRLILVCRPGRHGEPDH
jgi:hypothetical protein